jgi:hypothetical protein
VGREEKVQNLSLKKWRKGNLKKRKRYGTMYLLLRPNFFLLGEESERDMGKKRTSRNEMSVIFNRTREKPKPWKVKRT